MQLSTHTPQGVNKTSRYGWITKDVPGQLQLLHKDLLQIHPAYQRDVIQQKVAAITAEWSWISLGALVIGKRGGEYWVIDGQHRALAAKRRSDITELPCVVFETTDVKSEARGFLDLNTGRKPVSAIDKQKALAVAGDETAAYVQSVLKEIGIEVRKHATSPGHLKCIGWCMKSAAESRSAFRAVLELGAELSRQDEIPLSDRLLQGLQYFNAHCGDGLRDTRLVNRFREKGARLLDKAAKDEAVRESKGGAKIWAEGMRNFINKGLRNKFEFDR